MQTEIGLMEVFGIITARGGSKGLPGKNILPLAGVPLIGWTIRAAKSSKTLTSIIVSTDDPTIAQIAKAEGADVPFLRPSHLATDESKMEDVVLHALEWIKKEKRITPKVIVLLQATSPLRLPLDIDETVRLLLDSGADAAMTITEDKRHPTHRYRLNADNRLHHFFDESDRKSRRQDGQPIYLPSGSVYAVNYDSFIRNPSFSKGDCRGLVRDFESSVDIDDHWDFKLAELILISR